jgi:hypothetical protein
MFPSDLEERMYMIYEGSTATSSSKFSQCLKVEGSVEMSDEMTEAMVGQGGLMAGMQAPAMQGFSGESVGRMFVGMATPAGEVQKVNKKNNKRTVPTGGGDGGPDGGDGGGGEGVPPGGKTNLQNDATPKEGAEQLAETMRSQGAQISPPVE